MKVLSGYLQQSDMTPTSSTILDFKDMARVDEQLIYERASFFLRLKQNSFLSNPLASTFDLQSVGLLLT